MAHVGNITDPVRALNDVPTLKKALTERGGELTIPMQVLEVLANKICGLPALDEVCLPLFTLAGSNGFGLFDRSRLSAYAENGFCGTSIWTGVHFLYNNAKNQFAKFDYGLEENIIKYGKPDPPEYNLSAINSKYIILVQSLGDSLADPVDVMRLKSELTVPYIEYTVPYRKFSHLDFLWAENVYSQVYEPVIMFLSKFN